ncbi:hypothetical protein DFS34DRAFT_200566 [Phlyctochytrium arcticum]|nr:hypothetical protein DFS34DRAFT_200566 [Phlyctochytrium arcticum]
MAEPPRSTKRPHEEDSSGHSELSKKSKGTIPISRGKFKNRFLRKHSSLLHNTKASALERPRGILVTCVVGDETRALGQIRGFLDTHLPILFPGHTTIWTTRPKELDIDLKIVGEGNGKEDEEEVEEVEEKVPTTERRFQAVDAACGGLLFLRFRVDTDPVAFVVKLFEHIMSLPPAKQAGIKASLSRVSRILPVTHTMPSSTVDIISHLQPTLPQLLQDSVKEYIVTSSDTSPPPLPSLACITEIRNREQLKREGLREAVLSCVPGFSKTTTEDDKKYRIDLKSPDLVLFSSVFKSICGFAVLPHYYRFRKYNVQQIGVGPASKTSLPATINANDPTMNFTRVKY